jgi:hypothetical protein
MARRLLHVDRLMTDTHKASISANDTVSSTLVWSFWCGFLTFLHVFRLLDAFADFGFVRQPRLG